MGKSRRINTLAERVKGNQATAEATHLEFAKRMEERFESSQEAIKKAEAASEKRFDSVNEFRSQLADQSSKFVTRTESDLKDQAQNASVVSLRIDLSTVKDDLKNEIALLRESRSQAQGKTQGLDKGWGYLIACIVALMALLTFLNNPAFHK